VRSGFRDDVPPRRDRFLIADIPTSMHVREGRCRADRVNVLSGWPNQPDKSSRERIASRDPAHCSCTALENLVCEAGLHAIQETIILLTSWHLLQEMPCHSRPAFEVERSY